jgi:hypothetical protein
MPSNLRFFEKGYCTSFLSSFPLHHPPGEEYLGEISINSARIPADILNRREIPLCEPKKIYLS